MGYPAELGDYRNVRSGAVIPDVIYNRMPSALRSGYVKVVVAPPPSAPSGIQSLINRILPTAAPKPTTPAPSFPPTVRVPAANVPTGGQTTAQAAAPLIAAVATPTLGPIAAAIPPIIDATSEPSPVRIRVAPTSAPEAFSVPAPSDAGGGSTAVAIQPAEASVTDGASSGSPLDLLSHLPPAVLAAIAGVVLFTLSKKRRR